MRGRGGACTRVYPVSVLGCCSGRPASIAEFSVVKDQMVRCQLLCNSVRCGCQVALSVLYSLVRAGKILGRVDASALKANVIASSSSTI
jgi:hypothetical protein